MPRRLLLVGMADPEQRVLLVVAADELHADRETLEVEPDGDR